MMKRPSSQQVVRCLLMAAAAIAVFAMTRPSEEVASATVRQEREPSRATRRAGTALPASTAAYLTWLAHRTSDAKDAPALFATHTWFVPPPPPPPAPPPALPPAPTAPALPFALLGTFAAQGDEQTYFLARGDRIFDVKLGATFDNDYQLVDANQANLTILYKPMNARQTLALGGIP
jgi:hypothetical protein